MSEPIENAVKSVLIRARQICARGIQNHTEAADLDLTRDWLWATAREFTAMSMTPDRSAIDALIDAITVALKDYGWRWW